MFSPSVLSVMDKCVEWRRHLHERPELSFRETETTKYILEQLSGVPGIEIRRPTQTGCVAVLRGAKPGRTVAVRADIDALPIGEETGLPFSSRTPGVMHACGHDGHTAILLAAVRLLAEERDKFSGEARFLFQPAEELPPGGARAMADAGAADGVDEIYGYHLSSNFPTGTFGVRSGALTSATDRFDITVIGRGGHSAFPETCVDPIPAAAQLVLALQSVVSRNVRAVEPAVLSVCMVNAGHAYNIIPDSVAVTGSTRTFSEETRALVERRIGEIARGVCGSAGARCEYRFERGYASVVNDRELTEAGRRVIEEAFGKQAVLDIDPLMPGEDFSAFLDRAPGFFVEIGARNEEKGCTVAHHNKGYLMDEDALAYGVEYVTRLVRSRLRDE